MRSTLIESGGVKVADVSEALRRMNASGQGSSFGDGSGRWHSVSTICQAVGIYDGSQGGVRRCLGYLAALGEARRHPGGADFWR